jgi:hypothetical protein
MYGQSTTWTDHYTSRGGSGAWLIQPDINYLAEKREARLCSVYVRIYDEAMDKQVYLQPQRCIQIEESLEFTCFPAVNAKMKCREYPNAQDGKRGARSRYQILTMKVSNTPPAKFCALNNSRFKNLMYMHM